jgi:diadenosine tetraphosphate (Ap4A) HIT family hydrolase
MIDQNEYLELQTITRSLTGAISDAFHADMFNYASLGNIIKHVHLHVVPRYAKSVKFGALSFHDHNWGSNYSPYDKSFIIEPEVVQKIKMKIIESL